MKIRFISGREPTYVRNAMILKGLKGIGAEILECSDLSTSYLTRYFKVLSKYIFSNKEDVNLVFIGFLGQPLVPIIKKLTRKPIIFDAFISVYDTMCFDRKIIKPNSLAGKFIFWLDKCSCNNSDKIFLDTTAHIDYFIHTFDLPKNKFQRVFVGADDSIFYPRDVERNDSRFRVFYYASYLPLHGTEHIIQAAKILEQNSEIEFVVVGKGPQQKEVHKLAQEMEIKNINFVDWMPYENLPLEIAKADVCLGGHFSDIDKAKRVIAGKTFQFIAMKKPVIVGDCPANRELFTDKENALFVKMADAASLGEAILELRDNALLREQIAEHGYRTFLERCNTKAITEELKRVIEAFQ